ncbi:MAG: hypothetical protein WCK02_01630 [Bacteroidota bacterium]
MKTNLHLPKIVSLFALVLIQSLSGVALAVEVDHLHQEKAIKTTIMEESQIEILSELYKKISFGIRTKRATLPSAWLAEHKLSYERTYACYNAGNFQSNKQQSHIEKLVSVGFLKELNYKRKDGNTLYGSFGVHSVIFPLKDCNHNIVNFYAIGISVKRKDFLNQEGIYPCFPKEQTTKLFIVPTILDAATMLESKVLKPTEFVIALFDGKLMPQHEEAIGTLKHLKEIIWLETTKI